MHGFLNTVGNTDTKPCFVTIASERCRILIADSQCTRTRRYRQIGQPMLNGFILRADVAQRGEVIDMQLINVKIDKPDSTNFILGQTHFIKTVEDIHEALVAAVPGIKFGLAFCEASGKCLVRGSGTDSGLQELARRNAMALGAGHSFIVFLGEGFYPINVLNTIKMVPEVCRIFCATANPTQVVLAETEQGRGVLGVVDGFGPQGVENEADIEWRRGLLRKIGYKF